MLLLLIELSGPEAAKLVASQFTFYKRFQTLLDDEFGENFAGAM